MDLVELLVAAATAVFGFQSGAVLAIVVGVRLEVPAGHAFRRADRVATRGWYEPAHTG